MKVAIIIACDLFTKHSYGGKQCALSHVKLLKELFGEQQVKVFSFTEMWPLQADTQSENIEVYPAPKNKVAMAVQALQLRKVMSRKAERQLVASIYEFDPDLLWIDSSQLGRLLNHHWNIPVVVFYHNIEQLYAKNKVVHEGPLYLPSYWASKYNEKLATHRASCCICLNERDSALLAKMYNRNADMLLPICMEDSVSLETIAREKAIRGGRELLFVGSKFPPNVQGITWFVQNVMPQLPECKLKIVGKGFEELREQLSRENVEVIGGVDSLGLYYEHATAVVMPILYGDGMKVKTAEAMMYGKMIFASDEALVGYNTKEIGEIVCCRSEQEFRTQIYEYIVKRDAAHFYDSVRSCFLKKYELKNQKEALREKLKSVKFEQHFD